ncbi:MAG: TatD family hydrolase [Desulfamplus sp.]|nr:TatD family hydrolase [Desulfamplus sp.]
MKDTLPATSTTQATQSMGTQATQSSLNTISPLISNKFFFDAHCHLQEPEIIGQLDHIISRWKKIGGGTIVCCGTNENDWQSVFDIADKYNNILPCVGLHPWYINEASNKWADTLEKYLDQHIKNIGSIGEIGLDFLLKNLDPLHQEKIFMSQMAMAREYKVPVSIHVRRGWDIFIKILKKMGTLPEGGVIHSYSGSADMVKIFEKYGLYISFSGSITKPNNKKTRKALTAVSAERILIETDSPAILPHYPYYMYMQSNKSKQNKRDQDTQFKDKLNQDELNQDEQDKCEILYLNGWNEPVNLFMVALTVADILKVALPDVVALTIDNAQRLFRH